jgi:hypothetical protein
MAVIRKDNCATIVCHNSIKFYRSCDRLFCHIAKLAKKRPSKKVASK